MEVKKEKDIAEAVIKEKQIYIKEIEVKVNTEQKPFQIKSLIEIISKLNEENTKLKKEISELKGKSKGIQFDPEKQFL